MISISHEKFTLSNGLEVVLHEDHSLPNVAVNVWYHVGSKDEEVGKTGFAHLFEHVMFEGSKNHNHSFFEPLQKVGANINGSTTSDRTNYWENLPSTYLDLALWLEADRMGFLLDALDQKRFDVQRDVVKNERRQSYENRPYGKAYLLLQPAIFPAPHPYNWPVIGSQADLDSASLEDVKDFFRQYYAPSNASLAIAGDFEIGDVKDRVERYFGDIPPGPAINRVGRMSSALSGEVRLTIQDRVQLPRLYLVYPGPSLFDVDEAPLVVMATVMGDGKSSRLYRSLVHEKQIARQVMVGAHGQEIAGEFHIQVTASPGHTVEELQEVVEEELARLLREPPSKREIDRAKNFVESRHIRQLERVGGFGGRADQLNYYNVMAGDPDRINTDLERFNAVTADDVVRVVGSVLDQNRVRLAVLPEKAASASAAAIDRAVMPEGSAPRQYSPPVPVRARLSNGLDVLHIESREMPLVALGLVLGGGAAADPASRPGLAQMTAGMLGEGTAKRSSQQIADEMEFIGSELDSSASREHVLVSADTVSGHTPKVFEVIADVLQNATFPAQELERVRKERLADLKRIKDDPVAISQRLSRALLYGPNSKYGHPLGGTEQSVGDLDRDELVGHFDAHFSPENATLIAVGDVGREDLLKHAEEYLGDWAGDSGPEPASDEREGDPTQKTTIYLADKPGAAQSVIRVGQLMVPRHHPDYQALNLANYVFGGNPTARLFMNLREDKGYSYGYYSQIDWLSGPSALFAGGAVETKVTKESVIETLKEFDDIRGDRPVTKDEFDTAKDGLFRGFPAQFEARGQMLQQLSRLVTFGLPDDYYSTLLAAIDAVTLEDLHRVAAERVGGDRLVVLVVGDRETVEPGLQEIGLPIAYVDYEGGRID